MRAVLAFACRAFPPDHRARRSDEVLDTALLASNGSAWSTAREAASLVVAGLRQRLRAESHRSARDGFTPLAFVLAVVNLAVALSGVRLAADHLPLYNLGGGPPTYPFVVDWWWIAFALAAVVIVVGLVLGNRRLAVAAATANLAIVGYDALFLVDPQEWFIGHLGAFTYGQQNAFPVSRFWLPAAIVLVLATAAAPLRRLPLTRLALPLVWALVLVMLSREIDGSFWFLLWPLTAIAVLAIAFGGAAPRLAVLAVGGVLVAIPSAVGYLTTQYVHHGSVLSWAVTAGLGAGFLVPLAQLTRRRLT
jgi:hypothetical protein